MRIVTVEGAEVTLDQLRDQYPEMVMYDSSGFLVDLSTFDDWEPRLRTLNGRVALIWASEDDSDNDDGYKAIAEVYSGEIGVGQ